GTCAWRCWSNGAPASSSGTCTVTDTRPATGAGDALLEHAASSRLAARTVRKDLCRSHSRMHLPHQQLGRRGGGDPPPARGGEPDRVTLMQRPGALQSHLTK